MPKGKTPKRLFVAATRQDQGKTTISLGLLAAFDELEPPVGFIKPVGQRYVEIRGVRVDKDVALIDTVLKTDAALTDMSPITVGRNFTREYISKPNSQELADKILAAFARVEAGKNVVLIEGTGHAGVGSCFDMSNARVAELLEAKVVIITEGGIGAPIDETMLNVSLFRDHKVPILGVILNKVHPEKLDAVTAFAEEGLARKGIALLGVVPHEETLANPSMQQILSEVGGDILNGGEFLGNEIETVIVGAMTAHRALDYFYLNSLLITPGDRDDLILAAMSSYGDEKANHVAGMILTGGIRPHENIVRLIRRTQIPCILVRGNSYAIAAAVHNLKIKIQPTDTRKIAVACRLVKQHVKVQQILNSL